MYGLLENKYAFKSSDRSGPQYKGGHTSSYRYLPETNLKIVTAPNKARFTAMYIYTGFKL